MMKRRSANDRFAWMGVLVLVLSLSGCIGRSPDPRLFTMGSQPFASESGIESDVSVLVGPVRFPRYLERPQMTRRLPDGEISIDEFNRWAGGFEENVSRALSQDIAARLGSDRVVAYPSDPPFPLDYRVRIHFDEFVVGPDAALHVRVRWAVQGTDRSVAASLSRRDLSFPLESESKSAIVAAHDQAIRDVGRSIADQIALRSRPMP